MHQRYDPVWAQSWDAVGLCCGDPAQPVTRVHIAVDPVAEVVTEALDLGASLLVTHHPLFLGGTTSVAADTAKGLVVHRLITAGCGLLVAHTNADVADPGVSDALAARMGLRDVRPLQPAGSGPGDAVAAGGEHGLGRIGELPNAMSLAELTALTAQTLPSTVWGVRAAGDPARRVRTVAVCGGSGGDLAAAAAAAGAEVLLTSDLKHHSVSEGVADLGIALIDAAHWATEQPWCGQAADLLRRDLGEQGTTVEITVSSLVTDPWTVHHHPTEDL
jgi:dinuclear metal center YbgI/SA1388 family protein